jgi:tetratricopeptide (TPR) repeat protein
MKGGEEGTAGDLPDECVALVVLRRTAGFRAKEMAAPAGVKPGWVSELERGRSVPSREALGRFAEAMGLPGAFVDRVLALVREGRAAIAGRRGPPQDGRARARQAVEGLAAEAGEGASRFARGALTLHAAREEAAEERRQAGEVWRFLAAQPHARRRQLLDTIPERKTPALCALVCEASESAAADDASKAAELADLALWIARCLPGDDAPRAEGYASAFIGNARRVQGELVAADEAFDRSRALWRPPEGPSPFDPARVLDLEASLRRAQRRLPEALALLDRALPIAPSPTSAARILIKRAKTLEEAADYGLAIATLRDAAPLVEAAGDLSLRFAHRFNLAENLLHVGAHAEAEPMFEEVRALELQLGRVLHRVRLLWLEGRIAAGLGRVGDAIAALTKVRGELAERKMAYDMALVSLELAELYAAQGRMDVVRTLARQMASVFQDQRVHSEARKAIAFFRRAAEREAVTPELAHGVTRFLYRARHQPALRFEAA